MSRALWNVFWSIVSQAAWWSKVVLISWAAQEIMPLSTYVIPCIFMYRQTDLWWIWQLTIFIRH